MARTYDTYKDSGSTWVGRIPSEWGIGNFRYFGEFAKGKLPSTTNIDAKGVPIIGASEMLGKDCRTFTEETDIPMCDYDDILILWDGANAGIVSSHHVGAVSSTAVKYRCTNSNIDKNFLFHFMKSLEPFFTKKVNGTTIPHMNIKYINETPLLIPPLPEQQAIAAFLDEKCGEIDALIALQETMICELQAYKQSVITEAVTKGLDPNVNFKDSGVEWIGKIPEGWKCCRMKYLLNSLRVGPFGSSLKGEDFKEEGFWVYNQRIVLDENFESNNTFVNEQKYNELKSFWVEPGDFLITTRGSLGKLAFVPSGAPKGILHPCIIKFRIDESNYLPPLLLYIFNYSNIILPQILNMSNSTTIGVLYSYSLKDIFIPLPPLPEQRAIAAYLDEKTSQIDSLIALKQAKIEELKAYKKSIIYEYVTGKKRV